METSQPSGPSQFAPGAVSPDGYWQWNGWQWVPSGQIPSAPSAGRTPVGGSEPPGQQQSAIGALSPDGFWQWNGWQWVPSGLATTTDNTSTAGPDAGGTTGPWIYAARLQKARRPWTGGGGTADAGCTTVLALLIAALVAVHR